MSDEKTEDNHSILATEHAAPIRICFMIDNLAIAGTELHVLNLIKFLDRSRFTPFLCLLDGKSDKSRILEPDNCEIVRLGIRSIRTVKSCAKVLSTARFLRRRKIDILQTFLPNSTYFGTLAGRIARVPCILAARRNTGYDRSRTDRIIGKIISRLANASVANSEACRTAMIKQDRVASDSVYVIYNGIDISPFDDIPVPRESRSDGRKKVIGVVGNLRPVKSLDTFIKGRENFV